jgi:hypothetical protein
MATVVITLRSTAGTAMVVALDAPPLATGAADDELAAAVVLAAAATLVLAATDEAVLSPKPVATRSAGAVEAVLLDSAELPHADRARTAAVRMMGVRVRVMSLRRCGAAAGSLLV